MELPLRFGVIVKHIIRRARAIQRGWLSVTTAMTDHDLWQIVQTLLPSESICQLHHIKSHQAYHDELAWLQWACSANDAADKMAELAPSNAAMSSYAPPKGSKQGVPANEASCQACAPAHGESC